MNEREKRDFQAGLEQEVDAFLRGDTTRRTFITRFGQMTGMLAVSGPLLASMTDWAIAQQRSGVDNRPPGYVHQECAVLHGGQEPGVRQAFRPFVERRANSAPLIGALAGGMIGAFFSFAGWWDLGKLAGEVKNPARTLPRAQP